MSLRVALEVWPCVNVHREEVLPAEDVWMLAACLLQETSTVLGSWVGAQRKCCVFWNPAGCALKPAAPDGLMVHCTTHQEEESHLQGMPSCAARQSVSMAVYQMCQWQLLPCCSDTSCLEAPLTSVLVVLLMAWLQHVPRGTALSACHARSCWMR